jgi:hypothetical protein
MALPKNYQQTTNLQKRVESLNKLDFYEFIFDVKSEKLGELSNLLPTSIGSEDKVTCKHKTFALNEEQAIHKLEILLSSLMERGLINSYGNINHFKRSFMEEIVDGNLLDVINFKGS